MSLENPFALVLLVVPAILLWLRMRADRPRPAEASSLLVWEKVSPSDTVPEKPRPPLSAWIEAAGAAILVIGMCGPVLPGVRSTEPVVLVDGSPSMKALRPDGKIRSAAAESAEGAVVHRGHGDLWGSETSRYPAYPGITALLGAGKRAVVVTDHRLPGVPDDGNRLVVVGVGDPGFNAGFTTASGEILTDGRWRVLLVVEVFGGRGPLEGTLTIGDESSRITLQPGAPMELVREITPPRDWKLEAKVSFPGDALADDDTVAFQRSGGSGVAVTSRLEDRDHPVVRAAEAAGAVWSASPGQVAIELRSGFRMISIEVPVHPGAEPVEGRSVVAMDHPLASDVRIDPSVTMGARGAVLLKGVPVLADDKSSLVTLEEVEDIQGPFSHSILRLAFAPGGSWVERDPSFVVFAKNLVEFANGPTRVEVSGVLDSKETREAAEGETFGDLRAAIEEARRPDPASRASYAFALLMIGGGVLAAAWLAMR